MSSRFSRHSPGQRAVAAGPLGEAGKDRFQLGVVQNPQWAKLHVDRRGHLIRPGVEGHADNSLPIDARPSVADPAGTYPIRPDHVVPAARFQAGATQETEHAGFGSDAVGIAEHDIELFQRPVGPQPEREHVAGQVLGRKTAAHRGQVAPVSLFPTETKGLLAVRRLKLRGVFEVRVFCSTRPEQLACRPEPGCTWKDRCQKQARSITKTSLRSGWMFDWLRHDRS